MSGTTSACAENTSKSVLVIENSGNYLRVRGEYAVAGPYSGPAKELPPRARRILRRQALAGPDPGTTSACAENTTPHFGGDLWCRNYLRVRGEYGSAKMQSLGATELPPRARRIHTSYSPNCFLYGTTSACAENTTGSVHYGLPNRNYLRVRGEYLADTQSSFFTQELPPRARRILGPVTRGGIATGTTSACAENTLNELGLL